MRNIPILNHLILKIMVIVTPCILPAAILGQDVPPHVRLSNSSEKVGYDSYDWKVFVVASNDILNNIEYVEYTLHPTFPNPIHRMENRDQNFSLTSRGWGEFNILAKIVFRDNRIIFLEYRLKLEKRPYDRYGEINTGNSARYIGSSRKRWEVFIVAENSTLESIEYVEYILHPTFPNPVRRVDESKWETGFLLSENGWGSFTIGVNIVFKDGSTKYLEHRLRFPD